MKIVIAVVFLALVGTASANPIKCTVNGKTVYTDDPKACADASATEIENRVSTFPKITSTRTPVSPLQTPSPNGDVSGSSLLEGLGIFSGDVRNGWQTIMDAKKRGTWQEPNVPDDSR